MKCPNCGQEMKEDYLYCENCGTEIRIVPDFEPEIENSITETLSTMAEEIGVKEKAGKDNFFVEEPGKSWLLIKMSTLFVILAVVTIGGMFMYFNFSSAYQIKKAKDNAHRNNYEEAVKYLDRALEIENGNVEITLLQSGYYWKMKQPEKAVGILKALLDKKSLSDEQIETIYYQIINIYHEQEKFEQINALLSECPYERIVTAYQGYMAMEPEFSYEAGSYGHVVYLKLSANTAGKIYYTVDGSVPTTESSVYMAPIYLESGYYQINAFFVNEYGIASDIVKKRYDINVMVPDKPQVVLYSGKYEVPTYIEVLKPAQGTVYYTKDGSNPTVDSYVYTEPIFMPWGYSNYKFAVISDEGVSSEIVSRSFEFRMDTSVTPATASVNVMRALINRKVLSDMQGHAHGQEGKYKFEYNTIVQLNENYYYVLDEYYEDQDGNKSKTGLLYAVEVYTGMPNRLIYDEQGQMGLIPLTD